MTNDLAARRRPGVASVAKDLLTLVELQCQLAALDLKESAARTKQAIALAVTATTLGIAGCSVALVAAGVFLAQRLEWPMWLALATPAVAALAVAGVLLSLGMTAAKSTMDVFSRSSEEFKQNIESVKTSLEGDELAGASPNL